MWTRRNVLGLAFAPRSVTVVEVDGGNETPCLVAAGRFTFPDGVGVDDPAALGGAVRDFLRREGFRAKRCVIGMEARWLTCRQKNLPPGPEAAIAGILRLAVEREFAADPADLLTDYAVAGQSQTGRQVVVYAAPRRYVDQLAQTAQAARLRTVAITSSTAALAAAGDPSSSDQLLLNPVPDGVELAVLPQSAAPVVQRLSAALADSPAPEQRRVCLDRLAGELRRILASLPHDGASEPPRRMLVLSGAGLERAEADQLASRLSLSLRMAGMPRNLKIREPEALDSAGSWATAASLALMGLPGTKPVFDLLHSRMKPAAKSPLGRKPVYAGVGVAAALVFLAVLLLGWRSNVREIETLEAQLAEMAPSLQEAEQVVQNISNARPWYVQQPRFLEYMREVTLAFPEEGRIWTTSLAIEDDMRIVFSGKAVDQAAVLDVLDRLKANPRFADVTSLYLRESGRSQREVAFAMSCVFAEGS